MPLSDVRDQMARDDATRAIALIEGHERVCAERQGHIISDLGDLKRGVEGLYRRFWAGAIFSITLLLSACGALMYLILTTHR